MIKVIAGKGNRNLLSAGLDSLNCFVCTVFVCWPFIFLIYLMLSWPYSLFRLFAGLSFFWYTYGWLVAKSKLFISTCLLSFFLRSLWCSVCFIITICSFFILAMLAMLASLTGCFQTWLISNTLTMKLTLLIVSCLLFAAVHSAAVDLDSVHITDAEVGI